MPTMYVSPQGSGDRSGTSLQDAARITSLNSLIDKAGPGGQVLVRADQGPYSVTSPILVTNGGAPGRPVTIRGVDGQGRDMQATIVGDRPSRYDADRPGNELFKLVDGADNLKFTDLFVRDTGTVFRAGADISRVTIDDVDAANVGHFFENWASGDEDGATVSRLVIRNVDIAGFSDIAIRLRYDTNDVRIENVHADALGRLGDKWMEGVHLSGTVHDVLIRDTSMNNIRTKGGEGNYWNGDGFATERGVHDVRFEDTVANGNTDSGYDLKSSDTVLLRASAEGNGRNYRFWGEAELIDSVGLDPEVRGGISGQNQVWIAPGAEVEIEDSVFRDSDKRTVVFEGKQASVSFDDVDVFYAKGGRLTRLYDTDIDGLDEIDDHLVPAGSGLGSPGELDADAFFYAPFAEPLA